MTFALILALKSWYGREDGMAKFRIVGGAHFDRASTLNWPFVSGLLLGGVVWAGVIREGAVLFSKTLS